MITNHLKRFRRIVNLKSTSASTEARITKISKYVKGAGWAGTIIIGGIEIGSGVMDDGWSYGYNAQKATAGVAGGIGGAAFGAWAFGALGTLICPGIGTAVGATAGSMIFGYFGSKTGEEIYNGFVK